MALVAAPPAADCLRELAVPRSPKATPSWTPRASSVPRHPCPHPSLPGRLQRLLRAPRPRPPRGGAEGGRSRLASTRSGAGSAREKPWRNEAAAPSPTKLALLKAAVGTIGLLLGGRQSGPHPSLCTTNQKPTASTAHQPTAHLDTQATPGPFRGQPPLAAPSPMSPPCRGGLLVASATHWESQTRGSLWVQPQGPTRKASEFLG